MNLGSRIQKLERLEARSPAASPLDRFYRALDESAFRVVGKRASRISPDEPVMDLVMEDLSRSFFRQLSDGQSAALLDELALIAFGGDKEALEAAERDLERACKAGLVEIKVVFGPTPASGVSSATLAA